MKSVFFFLSMLLLLFHSCKKKDNTNPDSGYDPNKPSFRIGTKWVYVFKAFDQNGVLVNENEDQDFIVRILLLVV